MIVRWAVTRILDAFLDSGSVNTFSRQLERRVLPARFAPRSYKEENWGNQVGVRNFVFRRLLSVVQCDLQENINKKGRE
jgi:hypothetical protein